MWVVIIIYLIIGFACLGVYFTVDFFVTRKKLNRNQKLWDEYSKDMTFDEKMGCFTDWLEDNKEKHGDNFYYIPRM